MVRPSTMRSATAGACGSVGAGVLAAGAVPGVGVDGDTAVARCRKAIGGGHAVDDVARHAWRVGDEQGVAVTAFDLVDQVRGDLVAAVGKGTPAGGDFHRRQRRGAQGQGQVWRQVLFVEAEARDVVDGLADAHCLQQTDRHQVARLVQRLTQADRAEEGVGVVLRAPDFVQVLVDEHDRCVVDQAGGGVAVIQRCAVDERLEARTRLTLGLQWRGCSCFARRRNHRPALELHRSAGPGIPGRLGLPVSG